MVCIPRVSRVAACLAVLWSLQGLLRGGEAADSSFRFLVIADTHISTAKELDRFRSFLHTVRGEGDFLLMLGDLCGHAPEYLPQIREVLAHSGLTVYTLSGNHDDNYARNANWYHAVFSRMFYSFEHKGWRFIMNWSQAQPTDWVRRQVGNTPAEMPLVFCQHYPMPTDPEEAAADPWPLLARSPSLKLALTGHVHRHSEKLFGGKPWITLANCFFTDDRKNPGEYAVVQAQRKGDFTIRYARWQDLKLQSPPDELPKIALAEPAPLTVLRGLVLFRGTAQDDQGVRWVEYNLDRGPWVQALGAESWNFTLDTTSLANGHHVLQVRAVDGAGQPSIFLEEALYSVENPAPAGGLVLQQGLRGYTGCQDATVRRHRMAKKDDGTDGDASDLECWNTSNGEREFSEFYLKFDLASAGLPAEARLRSVKLELYVSRQNGIDSEGRLCGYLAGTLQQPWTPGIDFETRPALPSWFCPKIAKPAPRLTGTWPSLGGAQILWPPKGLQIDLTALKDEVRQWLKDPARNHGWVFSPAFGKGYNISFRSSRYPIPTLRPRLILEFDPAN